MKRYIKGAFAAILSLGLLVACAPKAQGDDSSGSGSRPGVGSASSQEELFAFTRENMPALDGSTSAVPLAQAVCAVLLGESRDGVSDLVSFSRTTLAYEALMDGSAQLLLAGEPEQSVMEALEDGDQWLLTPFATDALVFVVNEDNPVDDLTTQQVQQIYAGEITNWSQVGGADLDIIPFQRNEQAGSQSLMKKLVMQDIPLMEPPSTWISGGMGELMDAIRSYDDSAGALGFTVYYFAHDMEMARGLKMLSIDGVMPSGAAIREGSYPFLNPYYVAIDKDTEEGSPTRILYDWVLGAEGQRLVEQEGYAAIMAQEGT